MISRLPWKLDEDEPSIIYSADGDVVARDYTFRDMDDFEAICRLVNLSIEPKQEKQKVESDEEMCKLYLGNYGYPLKDYPHCEPPEVPKWAFEFIEKALYNNISRMNRITWAKQQLKILAQMLFDRKQDFFLRELEKIIDKIGK